MGDSSPSTSSDLTAVGTYTDGLSQFIQRVGSDSLWADSLLNQGDMRFKEHVQYLLHDLCFAYTKTNDVWTIGLPYLMLQDRGFDLAIFAIATQRLGISKNDHKYQDMSLSAYSMVLEIHRKLLNSNRPSPMLAVTSALLTFVEGAQPKGPYSARRVGHQSHFRGTIALMDACGPECLQALGYHDIFKKIRDMDVSP